FKAINRNKPFNGSAMNSPPTPPYYGSVAAALHLMNSQIRCGSCREKVFSVYRLAMDATRQGDFQKTAILFKAINRNKPFNGSAMNSPPTPPYCGSVAAALHLMNSPPTPPYYGSVAAALHLMNSQIKFGSCREKFFSVYRLAMDATRQGDEFATYSALLRLSRCGFALDEFTDKMRFLPGKGLWVFYKLRDKERSKESAYVLVAFRFLVRPFVSFVSRIARYAPSSTDKRAR
ncbi:MAG: hypothetical protein PUF27_03730, partial [Bacteroidales bacterium]|nr:hypothetical protein [Bacteroidales bacterium]